MRVSSFVQAGFALLLAVISVVGYVTLRDFLWERTDSWKGERRFSAASGRQLRPSEVTELIEQLGVEYLWRVPLDYLLEHGDEPAVREALLALCSESPPATKASVRAEFALFALRDDPDTRLNKLLEVLLVGPGNLANAAWEVLVEKLDPRRDVEYGSFLLDLKHSRLGLRVVAIVDVFPQQRGVLEAILEAARSDDETLRAMAADSIGVACHVDAAVKTKTEVIETVSDLIEDDSIQVREAACAAAGVFQGNDQLVSDLVRVLEVDASELVRGEAAAAVARFIGNPDGRAAVRQALQDHSCYVRWTTLNAVAKQDLATVVIPLLLRGLTDPDPMIRRAALAHLWRLPNKCEKAVGIVFLLVALVLAYKAVKARIRLQHAPKASKKAAPRAMDGRSGPRGTEP